MSSQETTNCDCSNISSECVNTCRDEINNWLYVFKTLPNTICFQNKYYKISDIAFIFKTSKDTQTFYKRDLVFILDDDKFKEYRKISALNVVNQLLATKQQLLDLYKKDIIQLQVNIFLGDLISEKCEKSSNKQFALFPENDFLSNTYMSSMSKKIITHSKWDYDGNKLSAIFKLKDDSNQGSLDETNEQEEEDYITLQYEGPYKVYSRIIYKKELQAFPNSSLARVIKYGREKEDRIVHLNSEEEIDLIHLIYEHKLFAITNSFGNKLDLIKKTLDYLCISKEDLIKAEKASQKDLDDYYQFFNQKQFQLPTQDVTCITPMYTVSQKPLRLSPKINENLSSYKQNNNNKQVLTINPLPYQPSNNNDEDEEYNEDNEAYADDLDEIYNSGEYWPAEDYSNNDPNDIVDYDYNY
jgi:hypothetical protein